MAFTQFNNAQRRHKCIYTANTIVCLVLRAEVGQSRLSFMRHYVFAHNFEQAQNHPISLKCSVGKVLARVLTWIFTF